MLSFFSTDSEAGRDHLDEGAEGAGSPAQTRRGPPDRHREVAQRPRLALLLLPRERRVGERGEERRGEESRGRRGRVCRAEAKPIVTVAVTLCVTLSL